MTSGALNLLLLIVALLTKAQVLSLQLSNIGRSTTVFPAKGRSEAISSQGDSVAFSEQPKIPFALLIDADNSQSYKTSGILKKIAEFGGDVPIRRVYGDFSLQQNESWRTVALTHSVIPVSVPMIAGKGSSDAAMLIDAMEILFTNPSIGGFALVSSDSDFTDLAQRLREAGKRVLGFGRKNTSAPLVNACESFIYTENLFLDIVEDSQMIPGTASPNDPPPASTNPPPSSSKTRWLIPRVSNAVFSRLRGLMKRVPVFRQGHSNTHPETQPKEETSPSSTMLTLIHNAIEYRADKEGWTHLGELGESVLSLKDDFNVREYGFEKLKHLLEAFPGEFQLTSRKCNPYVRSQQWASGQNSTILVNS